MIEIEETCKSRRSKVCVRVEPLCLGCLSVLGILFFVAFPIIQ